MQENQKKDEQKNPAVNQKKDGQQAMTTWKSKLFGIIVLLILGFVANYFSGDSGQELGQNNYPTEAAAISITPEVTSKAQLTPEISGVLTKEEEPKEQETKDDSKDEVPGKDTENEDGDKGAAPEDPSGQDATDKIEILYEFRRASYLEQHFEKHGAEFEYETKEEYLEGANRVIQSPDALHKIEAEDGDDIYYIEETNEFVVVSTDGYIRTYFRPSAGIDYYNRQ